MARNAIDDLVGRLTDLPVEERAEALELGRHATEGMIWVPNTGPQTAAYLSPADELLYGGEAGGGKTDLLLGVAINEHDVSQVFRLQHNDRVAIVRRLAQIWTGEDHLDEAATPPGYNGSNHIWQAPVACGIHGLRPIIEFGAMSEAGAWKHYQGRPASAKLWDELTQFQQAGFTTVNSWLRTVRPGIRKRVIGATNPPTSADGLWVVDYWAPWLDENHPNPAADGELRYFAVIDGHEQEVDASWRGVSKDGLVLFPVSRTFIRSTLADNPDLVDTDYASRLAAIRDPVLRAALAEGKFRASFTDAEFQVIPTDWVIAAQDRWVKRKADFDAGIAEMGPMEAIGVDCSGSVQVAEGESGGARMVMAPRHGTFFDELRQPAVGSDMRDPRQAAAALFFWVRDDAQANIDNTGGWGSGLGSILDSNRHPYVLCNFAAGSKERTRDGENYENNRAAYYWGLREALDPVFGDNIALPPGRGLLQELTAPRFKKKRLDRGVSILLEKKEDIEKRIGRSPDEADAVVLAWAERDALNGFGQRDGFHNGPTRGDTNRAHNAAKEKSRKWRNSGKG